jgi:2-oxoglutarate dehydrogenase E2 component (dihydrolipoamide succinyltransferase)
MNVLMPQLGETVLEGTVAAWYKAAGDSVAKGDLLLDVETDKAATEIEAPEAGVLSSINVPEGETVDVGTVLAVIAVEGESAAEVPAESAPPVGAASAATPAGGGLPPKSTGSGKLSPAVRRLLKQHDLSVDAISGTGRDGRVTRQDVQAFIEGGSVAAEAAPTGAAELVGAASAATPQDVERIPFDRFRKVTAEHMVRSKATSPHVLQAIDADFTAVDAVRLGRKDAWKADKGYSLTYLPFVARAVCQALAEFPNINASVEDESLLVHADINLAIAIDLNHQGLVAPVVRNAASLSVSALAEAFNDLVARAKTKKLTVDDLTGGTYTLSNPGPYGTLFTAPIINQPQVGILSMDAVKKRAVVIESAAGDSVGVRPVGILAHSFDHRAIDGAYSAAYLQRLKSLIESSDWSAEF